MTKNGELFYRCECIILHVYQVTLGRESKCEVQDQVHNTPFQINKMRTPVQRNTLPSSGQHTTHSTPDDYFLKCIQAQNEEPAIIQRVPQYETLCKNVNDCWFLYVIPAMRWWLNPKQLGWPLCGGPMTPSRQGMMDGLNLPWFNEWKIVLESSS